MRMVPGLGKTMQLPLSVIIVGITAFAVADSESGRAGDAASQATAVVDVKPLTEAPLEAGKWEAWREGLRAERQRAAGATGV